MFRSKQTMKAHLIALLLIISLLAHGPSILGQSTNQISAEDRTMATMIAARLRSRIDNAWRVGKLPGIQVGFSFVYGSTPDGKPRVIAGSFTSGVNNLSTDAPLTPKDRMPIGSVANTFLAAVALRLVEAGKLKLDDKISSYLGSEPWFTRLPNANDITLSMLLNQSSGLENHAANNNFQKQWLKNSEKNITPAELVSYVLDKKPLFPAGSDYAYSETNYLLAGMILEKVTGKPITDLISEMIIKPYKLDRTSAANSLVIPEVATGYLKGKPVIESGRFIINPQWEWAGGTFVSTAEDLARWANLLYGGEVLSASSKQQLINSMTTGEGIIYGLGVVIARSKFGRTYGHDGEFPGYLSEMRYYTKHNLAIAMLVNSEETSESSRVLASAVDDFAEVIIQATEEPKTLTVDFNQMQKLAESWLALIDAGDFDKAWRQGSDALKKRLPNDVWERMMRDSDRDNGPLKTRKLVDVSTPRSNQKLVALRFDTEFSKRTVAEFVVFAFEDGEWRVSSYSIR